MRKMILGPGPTFQCQKIKLFALSNSLDPDQAQQSVSLIWVQAACKGY